MQGIFRYLSMVLFFPFCSPATVCTAMAEEEKTGGTVKESITEASATGVKANAASAAKKWDLINYS
jgi:hypothetical protein